MKAVVIGTLAATAYSLDTNYLYPGTYTLDTSAVTGCCKPTAAGVTATQTTTGGPVTLAWTFDTCTDTDLSGKAVSVSGTPDASKDVTVTFATHSFILEAPDYANGKFNLNLKSQNVNDDCEFLLTKSPPTTVTYPGVYEVSSQNGDTTVCCYPTGDVIIREDSSNDVTVDFTFGTCTDTTYSGTEVDGVATTPTTGTKDVEFDDQNTNSWNLDAAPLTAGTFLLDLATIAASCSASLTKKTLPTLTYPRVYEVESESGTAASCCYPTGDITVTQDSSNLVTVGWTFESDCAVTALQGKTVSGTAAAPDSVTKDVSIVDTTTANTYTLEYPSTTTGSWKLDLSDIAAGCAVTLDTKSGYVLGLGSLVALSLSYIMF